MSEAEKEALDLLTQAVMRRAGNDGAAYKAFFQELGGLRQVEKVLDRNDPVR